MHGIAFGLKGDALGNRRFSERHSGQFAIAYVGMERPNKIKHYLVQKSDTAGVPPPLLIPSLPPSICSNHKE